MSNPSSENTSARVVAAMKAISRTQPEVVRSFQRLHQAGLSDGTLERKTKELMALACSIVLGCDGCVAYHLLHYRELGVTDEQIFEVLNVGLIVGGCIVIPHLRGAVSLFDELNQAEMRANP